MLKSILLRALPSPILGYLKKIHYTRELKLFSEKDEPDLHVVKNLIGPGDHVIDIGANVGWYTKVLSELVGPTGQVESIEPVKNTFEILSYCISRLGLKNARLHCCGISDFERVAVMEVPRFRDGGENFYRASVLNGSNEAVLNKQVTVALKPFDQLFLHSKNPIKFIKCDVEGHELAVVKGAQKSIAKFKPAWLIEVSNGIDEHGSPSSELFSIMDSCGYQPLWFNGEKLIRRVSGDKSVNYFFLTAEQQAAYESKVAYDFSTKASLH